MKLISRITFFQIMTIITFSSCKETNDTIIEPAIETNTIYPINLIENFSFESDSNFTLAMWKVWGSDTTYISSSTDVPPGGSDFSVRVKGTGMPLLISGHISYTVSLPAGTHRYRLSIWGKGYGMASISNRPGFAAPYDTKGLWFSESTWVERSLIDTLTATTSNSVRINLGPNFYSGRDGWDILFDLCRFEQLD